jgi:hypothetical protein
MAQANHAECGRSAPRDGGAGADVPPSFRARLARRASTPNIAMRRRSAGVSRAARACPPFRPSSTQMLRFRCLRRFARLFIANIPKVFFSILRPAIPRAGGQATAGVRMLRMCDYLAAKSAQHGRR